MRKYTAPSPDGVRPDAGSDESSADAAELYAPASKPSGDTNPVVVEGAFALLRTSLTSMLWFWPLREPSPPVSPQKPAAKPRRGRLR
jgi:hypothetical protein